jgi:hypothetical protein
VGGTSSPAESASRGSGATLLMRALSKSGNQTKGSALTVSSMTWALALSSLVLQPLRATLYNSSSRIGIVQALHTLLLLLLLGYRSWCLVLRLSILTGPLSRMRASCSASDLEDGNIKRLTLNI